MRSNSCDRGSLRPIMTDGKEQPHNSPGTAGSGLR
jgi:hypothetical protein